MVHVRVGVHRAGMAAALVAAAVLGAGGVRPAAAQITAVRGSALGYLLNVSLFNGPVTTVGPTPTVTLPAGGSTSPVTATAPTGSAIVGPATFFSSGQIDVSTQGTTGGGTVTTSTRTPKVNTPQAPP